MAVNGATDPLANSRPAEATPSAVLRHAIFVSESRKARRAAELIGVAQQCGAGCSAESVAGKRVRRNRGGRCGLNTWGEMLDGATKGCQDVAIMPPLYRGAPGKTRTARPVERQGKRLRRAARRPGTDDCAQEIRSRSDVRLDSNKHIAVESRGRRDIEARNRCAERGLNELAPRAKRETLEDIGCLSRAALPPEVYPGTVRANSETSTRPTARNGGNGHAR